MSQTLFTTQSRLYPLSFIERAIVASVLFASIIVVTGCGQKGDLYLVDNSQAVVEQSEVLASTSQPQDAAFAGIDDDSYEKSRYLREKQVLQDAEDIEDDVNDY